MLDAWFNRIWYARTRPPFWLIPFSWVFSALSSLRRWLYRSGIFKTIKLPVPVIVVGNITVGGTGKTPMTLAVVQCLQQQDRKPGIVLRGYKGQGAHTINVTTDSDPAIAGDEAVLLAQRSGCPVVIGKDRAAAVQQLLTEHTVDCIVCDDGLQHYRLARDLEIAVVDGERGLGNACLLPAGPLRESVKRFHTVNMVVINGAAAWLNDRIIVENVLHMQLEGQTLINVTSAAQKPLSGYRGQQVHGMAGIGNPQRFFSTLRQQGLDVLEHPLPDHMSFEANDIMFNDTLPVIMTEKDAVKCRVLQLPAQQYWYLPVRACFNMADTARLEAALSGLFNYTDTP